MFFQFAQVLTQVLGRDPEVELATLLVTSLDAFLAFPELELKDELVSAD